MCNVYATVSISRFTDENVSSNISSQIRLPLIRFVAQKPSIWKIIGERLLRSIFINFATANFFSVQAAVVVVVVVSPPAFRSCLCVLFISSSSN